MVFSIGNFSLKKITGNVDWTLLLFLVFFLNVKLAVKIPAIIILYLFRPNFKFGFGFKNSRLPLFYFAVIGIALIDLVVNQNNHNLNYLMAFLTGIVFWLLCLLAVHQIKLFVENNDTETIHRTIVFFFIINAIFSFCNIAYIMWHTGAVIPYRYQGEFQKYFISTGDYIKGVTFDTSTTNAIISGFGVIYFLTKKSAAMLFVCMVVLLLTGSNFTNLALLLILAFLFIFRSSKYEKSLIVVCLMFLVVFMTKISPENNEYVVETFKNIVRPPKKITLTAAQTNNSRVHFSAFEDQRIIVANRYLDSIRDIINQKAHDKQQAKQVLQNIPKTNEGRIYIVKDDITTLPFQSIAVLTPERKKLLSFIQTQKNNLPISGQKNFKLGLPGKAIGLLQTVKFLKDHPAKIITGDGIGNFSSKLAFRISGLGFAGGYPSNHLYINHDFLINHLDIYLNFFSKYAWLHSLANSPFSVYDQVLAEYGLLGLLVFGVFYWWFFAKHYTHLTYGIPLLIFISGLFFIDYWFEQLSVVILFELMMFLNIKESQTDLKLQLINEN